MLDPMRRHLIGVALGLSVCALLSACSGDGGDGATDPGPTPPEDCPDNRWPPCPEDEDGRARGYLPGTIAPEIAGEDQFGDPIALRQFRGATVVLSFGATWCGPCRADAAVYAETRAYLTEGLDDPIWMIELIDDSLDAPRHVTWAEAYGIDEPVIGGSATRGADFALAVSVFPTKFVIDYEGRIVGRLSGSGQWDLIRAWVNEAERRRDAAG